MSGPTLIIPGYHGSGPDHWQTWLEAQLSDSRRVGQIDWETPVLSEWAAAVRWEIRHAAGPIWLVAHSFGCLAAVTAAVRLPERVAGALLVAPADPDRFSPNGVRSGNPPPATESLALRLPRQALGFPSLIVASRDDPWMPLWKVEQWAARWQSPLIDIGAAGHINSESGFGPWPHGIALLRALQRGELGSPHPLPARATDRYSSMQADG